MDEIKENDYNLNIPRYVDTFEEEEEIDLDAVQVELEKIDEEDKKVTEELNKYFKKISTTANVYLKRITLKNVILYFISILLILTLLNIY